MKDQLKQLSRKFDKIIENQNYILSILNPIHSQKIIPTIDEDSKKNNNLKKDIELYLKNKYEIKNKFNLAATPQMHKILHYLRTNDPSIFDGLKKLK